MSKWTKLTLAVLVVVCLAALAVTGLTAQTKIVVMYNANELSEADIKAFEAENPDIKVEFIQTDWNRAMAMIAAGAPPNLMRGNAADIPYLASRGLLQNLTKFFKKGKYLKTSDFQTVMDNYRYDVKRKIAGKGPLYGLNKDYSLVYDVWYRKDIFKECGIAEPSTTKPMTFAEFYNICKKLVKREGDRTLRYATGGMLPHAPEAFIALCLASQGKMLYNKDFTKCVLTGNPEAVKIAKYQFDMQKERLSPSPIDPADNWDVPLMVAGRQAMYQFGFWAGACFYPELKPEQLGYFPAPKWGKKWINACSTTGILMFAKAPNNDAAYKFMDYYIGGAPCIERAKSGWGLPPLKSMEKYVPQETAIQKLALKVTLDQMKNSYVQQVNPYLRGGSFDTAWNKYLEGALKGQYSFEDFLKKVENEVNQAIQDGIATAG
ncbi:MAG: ABC transporter substrate-binding protein [Patescibacteria group bacterium]